MSKPIYKNIDETIMKELIADVKKFIKKYKDAKVLTNAEWESKGEKMCDNAMLHLTAEGELNHLLNGYAHYPSCKKADLKLNAIAKKHGFWIEHGYAWSWHFYPLATPISYEQSLSV
jgi:hypothetical protein